MFRVDTSGRGHSVGLSLRCGCGCGDVSDPHLRIRDFVLNIRKEKFSEEEEMEI